MKLNRFFTCLVYLAITLFTVTANSQENNNSSGTNLELMSNNSKLSNAEQILRPLVDGNATISVVVSLGQTKEAKDLSLLSLKMKNAQSNTIEPQVSQGTAPYYDLSDAKIRTSLASIVRIELDRFLSEINSFNLQSNPANDSSAIAPIVITNRFTYSFGIAATVTTAGLDFLLQSEKVVLIEGNLILKPNLTQGIEVMNGTATRMTYKGAGVAVAIVDTGVDDSHPDLNGGKVLGGYDFGDDDTNFRPTASGSAHGTAVGGIVAGDVNAVGDYIGGVASDAKLYGLKISPGDTGSASSADMVDAWEWAITHKNDDPSNPILVVNTSFGGGYHTSACDLQNSAMTQAALNGVNAGITHFVSSGNDGFCDGMGWPACISHVNSVGAVYDADIGTPGWCVSTSSCLASTPHAGCPGGDEAFFETSTTSDQVTAYSNSDTNLTIFAPSNNAYTTDISGAGGYSSGNYATGFGGTSAAAPYSAGAAAVIQSAAKDKIGRFLTPAELTQFIVSTGTPITDSKVNITKPRVDMAAAVEAMMTMSSADILEFLPAIIGGAIKNQ